MQSKTVELDEEYQEVRMVSGHEVQLVVREAMISKTAMSCTSEGCVVDRPLFERKAIATDFKVSVNGEEVANGQGVEVSTLLDKLESFGQAYDQRAELIEQTDLSREVVDEISGNLIRAKQMLPTGLNRLAMSAGKLALQQPLSSENGTDEAKEILDEIREEIQSSKEAVELLEETIEDVERLAGPSQGSGTDKQSIKEEIRRSPLNEVRFARQQTVCEDGVRLYIETGPVMHEVVRENGTDEEVIHRTECPVEAVKRLREEANLL